MVLKEILDSSCEWKPVCQFPNDYLVSDDGRVFSIRTQHYLRPSEDKDGYLYYVLCVRGYRRTIKAHRLVADAFIPNLDRKPTVDHINANRKDNRACNLRWATHEEQWQNPHAIEKHYEGAKRAAEKNTGTPSKYRKPVEVYFGGELVRTYPCLTAAAIDVRVSSGKASECANGKRDAVNGYVFKWAANPQER